MYLYINTASGQGDPHYVSFFKRPFDFQGKGEFSLLEVIPLTEELVSGKPIFWLQGRLVPYVHITTAAVHEALAFGDEDLSFQVSVKHI